MGVAILNKHDTFKAVRIKGLRTNNITRYGVEVYALHIITEKLLAVS